jgi:hypothetical protein
MKLSAAEIGSLWSPPTEATADRIERVMARWIDAPSKAFVSPDDPRNLIFGLGKRSDGTWAPVGIDYADLRYVMHITAPMGRGKSEWIKSSLLAGLFRANAGFMAVDCKGTDLVNTTLPLIPLDREKDVTILDLGGTTLTGEDLRASMNLVSPSFGRSLGLRSSQLASTVLGIFSTLDSRFDEAVGIKQFANMGVLALLEGEPRATMMHLIRFFGDEDYRTDVCSRIRTMQVKDFWDRRFPEMPDGQKSSLASFERRLDQLLTFPELSAMLVAPGCSIDMRKLMDNRGILLAGIRATEGQIASIAVTLLLTQMVLAALSRSNVPEEQRPDWPVIIDEAQIVFGQNPGMAPIMFSQLRAFRIGQVVIHQNLDQLANIMPVLSGNAQNRLILGAELLDAAKYGSDYNALGLSKTDFVNMPRFKQQYVKLYGAGNLFAARMLPLAKPLEEDSPEPVYVNWKTVRAPATSSRDKEIDGAIDRFKELARVNWDEAVQRLGMLCMQKPFAYDAFCARTRAHREAQRSFIINYPGCIPMDPELPGEHARLMQKETRIRSLSALGSGVPKLETEALQFALLYETRLGSDRRAEREVAAAQAKKSARKGGSSRSKTEHTADAGAFVAPPAEAHARLLAGAVPGTDSPSEPPRTTAKRVPTLAEMRAEREEKLNDRGSKRDDDHDLRPLNL